MEIAKSEIDVVIVGLGCVGLGAAYELAKVGYKVIGFERNSVSGDLGTGSFGHTRLWRTGHYESRYDDMI